MSVTVKSELERRQTGGHKTSLGDISGEPDEQ